MSISVPIFQMTVIERPSRDPALVFSSELAYSYCQDIAYCMPLYNNGASRAIYKSKEHIVPIMPIAKEKDIIYLEGSFSPPFVSFDLEQIDIREKIRFTWAFKPGGWITKGLKLITQAPIDKSPVVLRYEGNWKGLNSLKPYFLLLIPDNIEQFNYLYKEFKITIVGFTPHFGQYEMKKGRFES